MIRLLWIFFALTSIGTALTVTAAPAVSPPPSTSTEATTGTTIVGEQDSAMGLYLMPWKEEYASGTEQAPALLNVPPIAIDSDSLRRDTEYRDTAADYRRSHSQRSP